MALNLGIPKAEYYDARTPGLEALIREVEDQKLVAIDTETTGLVSWRDFPVFWSLAWGNRRICLDATILPLFKRAFDDPDKWWVLQNAKYDMHMLANVGILLAGTILDARVMHCLLYEEEEHTLEYMSKQLLGWQWKDGLAEWKKRKKEFNGVGDYWCYLFATDPQRLIEYASNDAYGTLQLFHILKQQLEAAWVHSLYPETYGNLWDIFYKTEAPFTKVLWKCERNGIYLNQDCLRDKEIPAMKEEAELRKQMTTLYQSFHPMKIFNPNSPVQVRDWFFEYEKMAPKRMSKGGKTGVRLPSVDSDFLDDVKGDSLMARLLLQWRAVSKTLSNYIIGLRESSALDPRSIIHPKFNQDVARCLAAGELVLTNRGYIPVEEVRVGDKVIAHTGKPRAVEEISQHAPQPIYRVRLSNGLELRTTGNHPYRTGDGWTRADALTIGTSVDVHSEAEKWRTAPSWDSYEVSSWGRVRTRDTKKIVNLRSGPWGHLHVEGKAATFYTASVVSITIEPPEPTYGLTVEIDHSHVTAGIVTHNTGRLSSEDPNAQNIANSEKDKFRVREAFQAVPNSGEILVCADQAQLEMRLLAAAALEQDMIDIFKRGWDIHIGNAAMVFNVDYEDVKKAKKKAENELTERDRLLLEYRRRIKNVGFG